MEKKEVLSELGLKMKTYTRVNKLSIEDGTVNLHPTKCTHGVAYVIDFFSKIFMVAQHRIC